MQDKKDEDTEDLFITAQEKPELKLCEECDSYVPVDEAGEFICICSQKENSIGRFQELNFDE